MEIVLSDYISWQYCLIFLLILLFLLWLFFGGQENLQYIGLSPLKIGVDASRNVEHEKFEDEVIEEEYEEYDENEDGEIEIDITPTLPDVLKKLKKEKEKENKINFTHSVLEVPVISISDSVEYDIKSPRSLALGEFTCYKNDKISKGELLCKQVIEDIYGVPFYCVRPNFLKNPETGRNLELDLYNDALKIGLEKNGVQHSVYPNYFHKTKEEFLNQVRRDQFKIDMCDKHGVYLITIPHTVPNNYDAIRKYIEYYLPENYEKRLQNEIK
jgi:hypothetical protein